MGELVITARRYSVKAGIGCLLLGLLLSGLMAAGAFWFPPLIFGALLPFIAALVWVLLLRAGSHYRLYPERLEVEKGVVSRGIDNIELFRIRDVGLRQGILGRMLNVGEVYIHSTDASTPDLVVSGIDQPREFYQALRERVTESRAHRQTMIVEEGGRMP